MPGDDTSIHIIGPDGTRSAPFTLADLERASRAAAMDRIKDDLRDKAAAWVIRNGYCSTARLQREFAIGYNRAARIVEQLEALGIVSPADHVGRRRVATANELQDAIRLSRTITDHMKHADSTARAQKGKPPMKHDPDFDKASDAAYGVAADELRSFVERFERLAEEKAEIADQQKEVMAEAKGRGYDIKVLRKVIALRKRKPDEIAEEAAVLEMYKAALGMT